MGGSSSKEDSSSESAKHNAMLMGILTEILNSRGTNNDKSKIINYLLDMQQNFGGSANKASGDIAKFIEKQLVELQSGVAQDVKITVEKKASVAKFIEKQLVELQSGVAQDVKITVEKKASGTASQPSKIDEAEAGPSSVGNYTHLMATTTVVPPRKPKPKAPAKPSFINNRPLQEDAKPLQKNFPNPQSTRLDYSQFEDLFTDNKAPQENLRNVVPTFKDNRPNQNSFSGGKPNEQNIHKFAPPASYFPVPTFKDNIPNQHSFSRGKPSEQDISKVAPPASYFSDPLLNNNHFSSYGQNPEKGPSMTNTSQQFTEKQLPNKMPFKPNVPQQGFQSNVEKNQQKQVHGNESFKNGKDNYDNGPFLDRGPPLLKNKDEGSMVNQDWDGNFYVKLPPPLMDVFANKGKFPNNGQNQGRGGPQNRFRGSNQYRGPRRATEQRYGPDPGRAMEQRYGPDPRNSQSPHQNQDRFHQDRNDGLLAFPPPNEGYFPGPNSEPYHGPNIANNRGAFQYRGDGARRPFPNRGTEFFSRGRAQHFQNQGRGDFIPGLRPEQQNSREYSCDGRQEQSIPGNHQPRMPRSERGNNLNHHPRMPRSERGNNLNLHPRSFSQPRVRHSDQTQENAGGQEKDGKQGNKGPRGSYRGQGAFPRARYNKGRGGGARYKKQNKQQGAWNAETDENKCDDSDNDSVKTDISTKSAPSCNFKEGVFIIREDGTVFATITAMEEAKKKKKNRSKTKNKLKNASSAANLTTSQNDGGEDTQSHSDTVEGVSAVEKDESSAPLENAAPLELLVGALDNQTLENLSRDQELGHAIVVIARVEDGVRSYHPSTVGELLDLKKKYPNAEVIVVR